MSNDQKKKLQNAVFRGRFDTVKELLECGADVNAKDDNGQTALMTAAAIGHSPIFHFLLDYSANVNESSSDNMTALLWAVLANDTGMVKTLIKKGADLNVRENEYGFNALEWALNEKLYRIVLILLENSVDVNNCNSSSQLRLMKNAKRLGFPEIAEKLKRSYSIP